MKKIFKFSALAMMAFVTLSCGKKDDGAPAAAAAAGTLAISPSSITLNKGESATFTASGGTGAYVFAVASGTGTITSDGQYTASQTEGDETVVVTDSSGAYATAMVTIDSSVVDGDTLTISPKSVTVNFGEKYTFTASGGSGDYTFSVTSGDGEVDSETGEFTAPNSTETDKVTVTDSNGDTATATVKVKQSSSGGESKGNFAHGGACIGGSLCKAPMAVGTSKDQLIVTFPARTVKKVVFRAHDKIGNYHTGKLELWVGDRRIFTNLDIDKKTHTFEAKVPNIPTTTITFNASPWDEVFIEKILIK